MPRGSTATAARVSQEPDFRRLWLSDAAQEVARQLGAVALSVTAVVVLDAAAWQVGLLTALGTGAYLVIGLPARLQTAGFRSAHEELLPALADLLRPRDARGV